MRGKHGTALLAVLSAGALCLVLALLCGTICPVSGVFGIPCPFCGLTRAASRAIIGDYAGSLEANPTLVLVLCDLLVVCDFFRRDINMRINGTHPGRSRLSRFHKWFLALSAAAVAIVWVWRMVTMFPDTPPMTWHEDSLLLRLLSLASEK